MTVKKSSGADRPRGGGRRRLNRFKLEMPPQEVIEKYLSIYHRGDLYHNPESLPEISSGNFFGNNLPLALDFGCGRGEFSVDYAKENPDTNIMGIDIHYKSLYDAVRRAWEANLDNVRFLAADLKLVVQRIPPETIKKIFILFPPPVTKQKFQKKEFITPEFISRLHESLVTEGNLHFVTDHEAYFREKEQMITETGLFTRRQLTKGIEGGKTWYQKVWEAHGLESFRAEYVKAET